MHQAKIATYLFLLRQDSSQFTFLHACHNLRNVPDEPRGPGCGFWAALFPHAQVYASRAHYKNLCVQNFALFRVIYLTSLVGIGSTRLCFLTRSQARHPQAQFFLASPPRFGHRCGWSSTAVFSTFYSVNIATSYRCSSVLLDATASPGNIIIMLLNRITRQEKPSLFPVPHSS